MLIKHALVARNRRTPDLKLSKQSNQPSGVVFEMNVSNGAHVLIVGRPLCLGVLSEVLEAD